MKTIKFDLLAPPIWRLRTRLAATLALSIFSLAGTGQSGPVFEPFHSFGPENSAAPLIQASDGMFYGTTVSGGTNGYGSIFQVGADGTYTTLYSFTGGADGAEPYAGLLQPASANGSLYGTTANGGANGYGTVFQVTTGGTLTALYSFTGTNDGANPLAALVQAGDGYLYGATPNGGAGYGTICRVALDGAFTTVYAFTNGLDGGNPVSSLVLGSDGGLYGTTSGTSNFLFRIATNGTFSVLLRFPALVGTISFITQETGGDFFASQAGRYLQILGTNDYLELTNAESIGSEPEAPLLQAKDGNFYGPAAIWPGYPDLYPDGFILRLTSSGVLSELYSFAGTNDGANPRAALIEAGDGKLYGTAFTGGAGGNGTVFDITTNGTFALLSQLQGGDANANSYSALIQASDGNFYGTTAYGGAATNGTVFKMTPAGVVTTLYAFTGGTEGGVPNGGLVQYTDGNLYGTTSMESGEAAGTLFAISPAGGLVAAYPFGQAGPVGTTGVNPRAGLTLASDGNLYGTAFSAGPGSDGTIFRFVPPNFTLLYAFSGPDGAGPSAPLIQAGDGNLYGTTMIGGTSNFGTIFRITTNGALSQLHSFKGVGDGQYPVAGLIQARDGNLYGTAEFGGVSGNGTAYRITTNGTFTALSGFAGISDANPQGPLMQASDGNFYGALQGAGWPNSASTPFESTTVSLYNTSYGGGGRNGMVYQMTTDGAVTPVYSYSGPDGSAPVGGLIQASDGALYGTALSGGATGNGTVFRIVLPPQLSLSPPSASAGNFAFSFQAAAGQSYTIQQSTNIASGGWTYYTNFTGAGSNVQLYIPLTNAAAQFFRLRQP